MLTANCQARLNTFRKNQHPPRQSRKEKDWRMRYNHRLLNLGVSLDVVLGLDPDIDLGISPEDAADDELYYMAQDQD